MEPVLRVEAIQTKYSSFGNESRASYAMIVSPTTIEIEHVNFDELDTGIGPRDALTG